MSWWLTGDGWCFWHMRKKIWNTPKKNSKTKNMTKQLPEICKKSVGNLCLFEGEKWWKSGKKSTSPTATAETAPGRWRFYPPMFGNIQMEKFPEKNHPQPTPLPLQPRSNRSLVGRQRHTKTKAERRMEMTWGQKTSDEKKNDDIQIAQKKQSSRKKGKQMIKGWPTRHLLTSNLSFSPNLFFLIRKICSVAAKARHLK